MALIEEVDRKSKGLTTEAVRKLKPTDTRQEIADKDGLYLVIQPSGVKSWVFRVRVKGKPAKITLGRWEELGVKAARDLAGEARKAAHAGVVYRLREPTPEPKDGPEAAAAGRSVEEVWGQYCALRLQSECRPTTVAEHKRIFSAHISPKIGTRDIGSIAKDDLLPIADAALARGFSARNKTVAVMTGFFNWCHEERDLIATSPTRGLKQRTVKGRKAKRALTDVEIKVFWKGCDAIDAKNLSSVLFGKMFQLLLLTGARRNEIAGLPHSEIEGNVWTLPADRAKNGVELKIHLCRAMQHSTLRLYHSAIRATIRSPKEQAVHRLKQRTSVPRFHSIRSAKTDIIVQS